MSSSSLAEEVGRSGGARRRYRPRKSAAKHAVFDFQHGRWTSHRMQFKAAKSLADGLNDRFPQVLAPHWRFGVLPAAGRLPAPPELPPL